MAKKVLEKLKEEVERKGLDLSVTENEKERKSKTIASCGFFESEQQQGRRSDNGRQRGNVGRRLENKSEEVGSTRTGEKEEVQAEILDYQKN